MMKLYSKRYNPPALLPDQAKQKPMPAETKKMIKTLYKEVSRRPLPERAERLKDVLGFAEDFAERYKIDIDIVQGKIDIQVRLHIHCLLDWEGSIKDDLCVLIDLCDEMGIKTNKESSYDIAIVLKFFTHAIYRGNKKILPVE